MQSMSESSGYLLVDKASGWTSFDVVAKVRSLSGVKKVGHAGTLDPFATGLLLILVGKAWTRQQDSFMKLDKTYLVKAKLGVVTDTYDVEGEVVATAEQPDLDGVSKDALVAALDQFRGEITQQVPSFSAVKVAGRRLYEMARKGKAEEITLPTRQVSIHSLDLVTFDFLKKEFVLRVECSSGTYVRSLVHDIGQVLKVGAHATELRRENIGVYSVSDAVAMEELVQHSVQPYLRTQHL